MSQTPRSFPVTQYAFQGTHRDMGRQQGEALAALIRSGRDLLLSAEEIELIRPRLAPPKVFLAVAQWSMWMKYTAHIRRYFPAQFERLMGIARGARVAPEFVMLLHAMEVEMNKADYFMPGACSAAGVRGTRAAAGEPVVIKNFDYPDNFREMYIVRQDTPRGRARVLCSTAAPLAGNHDGINEHGLVICYNYGYGQDEPQTRVPITFLVQEALETCRTTVEAVSLLTRSKRCGGALLLICDAGGDLCSLELSNTLTRQRLPQHSVVINTNHYLDDIMARIDVPRDAVYTDKVVRPLRGVRCRESSEIRYARILELLAEHETLDDKALMKIFADHGPDGLSSDNTICRHSDYFNTTAAMVFYPARRTMKIAHGNPCCTAYEEFAL